ncbi:MAG TPA: hypothetical protein VF173_35605 [Thermoanaerobaculia bacterium]|nr:hypothetical protein [Thermoanaerobaculia bacterium]
MSILKMVPRQHPNHSQDEQVVGGPNLEELQRLLGDLFKSGAPLPATRGEKEIRIRNFRSDRFELTDDLLIAIEERGDEYVATSYDTGQYGIGYSPEDSIQDLCSVLEEYFDVLAEDEERLGRDLKVHLVYLRSILRERQ